MSGADDRERWACKWSKIKRKQAEQQSPSAQESDLLVEEIAALDYLKFLEIEDEDWIAFRAIDEDQCKAMTRYAAKVDEEQGLNNYLADTLDLLGGADDLDTSKWTFRTSLHDPDILELLEQDKRCNGTPWLSYQQLGLGDSDTFDAPSHSNKRPRTTGPSFTGPQPRSQPSTSSIPQPRSLPPNYSLPRPPPAPTGPRSYLPDRLKSRIYPERNSGGGNTGAVEADGNPFQTATAKYATDCAKTGKTMDPRIKKSLGGKNTHNRTYQPPRPSKSGDKSDEEGEEDERLKGIDKKLAKVIMNEIMDTNPNMRWEDIAGLETAKKAIKEIVVWPMLRPDIFTGLRGPPKGVLLFGPPGTGKTLIGKCIASQSKSTFFTISASSLTSKWIGEGEKLVRALFAVARLHQPSVIFIDEIDSLLTQRSESEHESSRRIKTEFLIQLDGVTSGGEERLLLVGATNRPQELDEAARRRLVKRLYIPLPDKSARIEIVRRLLTQIEHTVSDNDLIRIADVTDGYSGADMTSLCRDAALAPLRSVTDIENVNPNEVRALTAHDIMESTRNVKSSVNQTELHLYETWNSQFGCG